MIEIKQHYFIALYNLHLAEKIPPSPEDKEKLVATVYRYFDSLPLNTMIPQKITQTGEKSYRQLFDDGSSLEITKADLVYSHPQEKDWWTEKYQIFFKEYTQLRNLINGYIDGKIKLCYLLWLDDRLEKINTGLVWRQGTSFQIIQMKKYEDEEIFLLPSWIKPQQRAFLQQWNSITTLFFPAYLELIGVFAKELLIQRCIAYQTTRTPACRNIFILSGKQGPEQQFCSDRCRRRIFEHEKKHPEDRNGRHSILDAKMSK